MKLNKPILYILLLSLIIRLFSINQSLWLDEATTAMSVTNMNFIELITVLAPNDFHPPLYYLVIELWSSIFGTSEIALRLPSVIFGMMTVYLVFKIGTHIKNESVGLLSALLLSLAPLHVYYSQEARMYSMATFFIALSVYYFIKSITKKSLLISVGSGLLFALAFLTDYTTIFMAPAYVLIWFLSDKRYVKKLLIFFAPLVLVIVSIFQIFANQFSSALDVKETGSLWWNILGKFSIKNIALIPVKFIIGRIGFDNKVFYALYVGVSLLVTGGNILSLRKNIRKNRETIFIAVWLVVPIVSAIAFSTLLPILSYFRLLFALPALYILISLGIFKMNKRLFMPVLVGALLINLMSSGIYLSNSVYHREDWKGLVKHISEQSTEDLVVFSADSQMEAFDYYNNELTRVGPDNINFSSEKIWLMRYVHDIYDPRDEVPTRIEQEGFNRVQVHNFNGVVVWEYENSN